MEVWPTVSTKIWSACLSAISVDLHNDWSSISSLIVKFCNEQLQIWNFVGRTLYYSAYLILSKYLEKPKTHTLWPKARSKHVQKWTSEDGLTVVYIYKSPQFSTNTTVTTRTMEWTRVEKISSDVFYCGKLFLQKKGKADGCHFDICLTKLMWTNNIFSQKKVPWTSLNIKWNLSFKVTRNWKAWIAGWQDGTIYGSLAITGD